MQNNDAKFLLGLKEQHILHYLQHGKILSKLMITLAFVKIIKTEFITIDPSNKTAIRSFVIKDGDT